MAKTAPDSLGSFLFTQLSAESLTPGRPFDALAPGTFTDMVGRRIVVKPEDLAEFVANTQAAIDATKTESGELVGLPIDAVDHENGDGAGWVVGVHLEGELIRFTPKWTGIGAELLTKGLRRFFSAVVDPARKVLMGGTLTNWPATRDVESGNILLRPIELSRRAGHPSMFQLVEEDDEESHDSASYKVRVAWSKAQETMAGAYTYVVEVFESYAVIEQGGEFFQVPFSADGETISFGAREEWTQVKSQWVEASQASPGEGDNMTVKLTDADHKAIATELAGFVAAGTGAGDLTAALSHLVDTRAQALVDREMERLRGEQAISEFAEGIVGGTEEQPGGLAVTAEEVEVFLGKLTPEQRTVAQALLEKIRAGGVLTFTEAGHRRTVKGKTPLPKFYAEKLRQGELLLANLRDPMISAQLGSLDDYDLSEFEKPAAAAA